MTPQNEDQNLNGDNGNRDHEESSENKEASFKLRLFVTGDSQRSQKAIDNIKEICQDNLEGQYDLEVIDVYQNPDLVRQHQILAVPTLLKELPPPLRKVIGDLSEKDEVLAGLDLQQK